MRFPLLPNLEILGSLRDDEDNRKDIVRQIVCHCKVIVTCIMLPKYMFFSSSVAVFYHFAVFNPVRKENQLVALQLLELSLAQSCSCF